MDGNLLSKSTLAYAMSFRSFCQASCCPTRYVAAIALIVALQASARGNHPQLNRDLLDAALTAKRVTPMPTQIAAAPDLVPIAGTASERVQPMPQIVRPQGRVLEVPSNTAVSIQPEHSAAALTPNSSQSTSDVQSTELPASSARPVAATTIDEALESKGSISFRKTPLNEVIFLLSDLWSINIVAGENISGEVSGTFHNTALREVLSAVLTASDYSYRKTGNSLVVLPIDQIGSNNPDFVSRTIRLPSSVGEVDATLEAAGLLLSQRGQLRKIGTDSILVIDEPNRIDRIEQLLTNLSPQVEQTLPSPTMTESGQQPFVIDAPTPNRGYHQNGIAYFTPQFTEAEEMTESLQAALGDNVIVATFAEENRIMVKGSSEELRLAAQAIEQLDVPRAQVRITALIYDVGLKELEKFGVNWSKSPHSQGTALNALNAEDIVFRNTATAASSLISNPAAEGATSLALRTINSTVDASMLLQAVDSTSEAKLLADPSITVGDRREASIRIVQRIPIIAAEPVDTSGVVFSQVQFEDAGIILNVTPRISRDGTIEMQVQPEYSVVVDYIENNPVIDSRTAQTTVRVGNGQLFVLGGLRQKNITEVVRGVPYLKEMKYLGKLFRSHETEVRESELIVFLKPELVTPYTVGKPREERAGCVSNSQLDRIPYASCYSQLCDCENPYCPNHHPRRRINGGSAELEMLGGQGMLSNTEMIDGETIYQPSLSPQYDVYQPEIVVESN